MEKLKNKQINLYENKLKFQYILCSSLVWCYLIDKKQYELNTYIHIRMYILYTYTYIYICKIPYFLNNVIMQ